MCPFLLELELPDSLPINLAGWYKQFIIIWLLVNFRKLVSIVGLGMGNIFGLLLSFMPNWWSFLIFWVLMMGTIHAAHISASVYETKQIILLHKATLPTHFQSCKWFVIKLLKWWAHQSGIMARACLLLLV